MSRTSSPTRWLALSGALALVLAACDADVEVEPDDDEAIADPEVEDEVPGDPDAIVIGWTPPDITGVFLTATDFFEMSAEEAGQHGIQVQVLSRSPATHVDFADQLAIIEDYITAGVDAIAISSADTEAIVPAVQEANEAGIPVIMVNLLEEQPDIDVASYIGFDNSDAAAVTAYSILDYFGGPGVLGDGEKVDVTEEDFLDLDFWEELYADVDPETIEARGVIIEGIAGTFFSQARLDGFHSVIDRFPNVETLAEPIPGDWNRELGTEAAEDFLTRFGEGELDFIWAASNEMGLGAMLAAEAAGRLDNSGGGTPHQNGMVAIFTNDVTPESVAAIQDGGIIAETHHGFAEWGWFGAEAAVRLACGLDVEYLQDIRPRIAWEANAHLFYPEPALPDIDWQSIADECL